MSEMNFLGLCPDGSRKRSSDPKCWLGLEFLHFNKTGNHAY